MIKRTISFNEALHSYTDEENNPYTSVTQIIGKYEPPFDVEYWSKQKAIEYRLPQSVIKQNWKDINQYACEKGNRIHKIPETSVNEATGRIENSPKVKGLLTVVGIPLNTKGLTNVDLDVFAQSSLAKLYPEIFEYLKKLILQGCTIYVEKRVYWYEYLVAGTIDCLVIKGKQFMIVDWKTNKDELKFESGYYKKVNGIKTDQWVKTNDKMLSPINYLPKCKGTTYTIQLSLYALILELWGMECIGLVLFHIRDNNRPKLYNIKYDRSSSELLLIDNKNVSTQSKRNLISNNDTESFGIT